MAVQMNYEAPKIGVSGGLYDLTNHVIDSRTNEAQTGEIFPGYGVARGELPGSTVKTVDGATEDTFEGVVVSDGSGERVFRTDKGVFYNGDTLSVLRTGRVWVAVPEFEEPAYGDPVKLIVTGVDKGKFGAEGTVEVNAKFLGKNGAGIAAAEFFSTVKTKTVIQTVPEGENP
jgi:hypothetical protein